MVHFYCLEAFTVDEYLAILLHDGQYITQNEAYKFREPVLAIILHHVDIEAVHYEKLKVKEYLYNKQDK